MTALLFLAGACHELAERIEHPGAGGTRPGHKHWMNDVELGAALAKAALTHETQGTEETETQ